jgi:hypothetical protein
MKSKSEIDKEAKEIYFAIKQVMQVGEYDHCQSWWINTKNFELKSKLKTPQINQRCKLLIKKGLLTIDIKETSTSQGTCYRLTDKSFLQQERKEKLIKWKK